MVGGPSCAASGTARRSSKARGASTGSMDGTAEAPAEAEDFGTIIVEPGRHERKSVNARAHPVLRAERRRAGSATLITWQGGPCGGACGGAQRPSHARE